MRFLNKQENAYIVYRDDDTYVGKWELKFAWFPVQINKEVTVWLEEYWFQDECVHSSWAGQTHTYRYRERHDVPPHDDIWKDKDRIAAASLSASI